MQIEKLFKEIRELYFPRWDRNGEWKAVFGDADQRRNNTGYCDSKAKVIYLNQPALIAMTPEGVRAFLIHEICHDTGAAHHNRRWANAMERAAKRADELGETDTASNLRSGIISYCRAGVLEEFNQEQVLSLADELVRQIPKLDVDEIVMEISRYFGISRRKVQRDFGAEITTLVHEWRGWD